MKVFIAGPMQGQKDWNIPAFQQAEVKLREAGYTVVNPADGNHPDGWKWNDYLANSIAKLVECDAIALLPGWQVSKGARLEHYVANALDLFMIPLDQYGDVSW